MKKFNIAQIGTFDLENFGDLLFPNVLEKNLKDRLDCNLVLFSPIGGNKPFEENVKVYPISDFDKLQKEYNFDAIILGGGDLLRLDDTVAKKDMYSANNPAFGLFVLPSVFAEKYNIPLYYNVPGAPYAFFDNQKNIVKAIAKSVSYFSVRDSVSKSYFNDILGEDAEKIAVSPDSIFDITSLYSEAELNTRNDKFLSDYGIFENKYIVFQSISALADFNEDIFASELDKIAEKTEFDIIFMPITYVHNDADVMKRIFDKMKTEKRKFIDEHLSPFEMTALLSKSGGYIGSSLHGGIVSMAYGKTALAINLVKLSKVKGIYSDLGLSDNIVTSPNEICDKFLNAKALGDEKIAEIKTQVSKHFDNLCEKIKSPEIKKGSMISEIIYDYFALYLENVAKTSAPLCTAYFDCGNGFSEANRYSEYAERISDSGFSFSFSVPNNAQRIRFDTGEGKCCIVTKPIIECDFKDFSIAAANGTDYGNFVFFNTTDPQFNIEIGENIADIKITFDYIPLIDDIYSDTILKFIEIEKEIKNQHYEELENYDKKIHEITKEKEKAVAKSNELSGVVASQNNHIRNLTAEIQLVHNSFFWKVTKPMRVIADLLKKTHLVRLLMYIKRHGLKATAKRILRGNPNSKHKLSKLNESYYISNETREKEENYEFPFYAKFSVLVPLYNTPEKYLREMIESVIAQTYKNWELCLADGSDEDHAKIGKIVSEYAKKDNRIKYEKLKENLGISENTNACIKMSSGDYIALFDHDDLLHPSALFEVMKAISEQNADYVYTDENTFSETPEDAYNPHFKPDFSPDTLRSYNYICHFSVFSKELLDSVGYFNSEYDGSQDYDIILRLTEKAKNVVHIPKILYYWRAHKNSVAQDISAKPYTVTAAKRALSAHLERVGLEGEVEDSKVITTYHIKYKIKDNPLISIIIPNKDHTDDLEVCLSSIYEKSTYKNFEVIIVENNSTDGRTFDYYERAKEKYENLKVVIWEDSFNYSKINNFGAKFARGEYLLLLNNDVEIISPDWLSEMLMFVQRNEVGACGAKLYFSDDTIQHAGVIIGIGGVAGHSHKYFSRSDPGYFARATIAQNLSCCTAACLMIKKSVFDEVGGLDEKFAVAFNDVDLCMKIRKAGYLIVFTPYAELYHYESKSRGLEDTPEKVKRFQGEIQRFFDKWQPELDKGDPYYNPNLTLEREDFSIK